MSQIQFATFRIDVTPPLGHPLCASWMQPSLGVTDPLYCDGIILHDGTAPIVLFAIDWCEISNRTYQAWLQSLADAVGTTPDRVTVHCMHPHCSPWPDIGAHQIVKEHPDLKPMMDVEWEEEIRGKVCAAAKEAMGRLETVTHIAAGKGKVDRVASNRRVMGDDGKVKHIRWCRTFDLEAKAAPEGLIDPWLKTISFWNGDRKLAAVHYYAVHPSSYEDRYATPDFTGLARDRRTEEEGGVPHIYFTECAGNITAGKYNDGAKELREVFTQRIHDAMVESEKDAVPHPLKALHWATTSMQLPPREDLPVEVLHEQVDAGEVEGKGNQPYRAALILAYHERYETPIDVPALRFEVEGGQDIVAVHLPGESFMEFQYYAQEQRPDDFVLVPSYADCGPGYICMETSFDEGGYEPHDSFVAGRSEGIMKNAISDVLKKI